MIFHDPKTFSDEVLAKAEENGVGFMEAILIVCELHNIDPSAVGELITPPLKAAIKTEATNLHFFKKKKTSSDSASLMFE